MVMNWVWLAWGVDLRIGSVFVCRLYVFLLFTSKCCSAWLIVAVSVERLIVMSFPLRANMIVSRQRAWAIVISIVLVLTGIYLPLVWPFTLIDEEKRTRCSLRADSHSELILKMVDLVVFALVPAVLIFFSNMLLARLMLHERQKRSSIVIQSKSRQDIDMLRLPTLLFMLTSAFLLLNLPMALYQIALAFGFTVLRTGSYSTVIYHTLYTMQLLNSTVNFILYCLSAPVFRRQVALLFDSILVNLRPPILGTLRGLDLPQQRSSLFTGINTPSKEQSGTNK